MPNSKRNGLTATNSQPVKLLTKYAHDFIAAAARYASVNSGYNVLFPVLALQFVLIAWGVTL